MKKQCENCINFDGRCMLIQDDPENKHYYNDCLFEGRTCEYYKYCPEAEDDL